MATLSRLEVRSFDNQLVELPPHARLPRLDLGIDWESRGEIFRSSVAGVLTGPPTPKDWELKRVRFPRIDWIEGKLPGRAFLAAALWHVVIIWALVLPIWWWLPEVKPNLAPVEIELTLYDPPDLPKILLPENTPKLAKKPDDAPKQPVQQSAENFHPRQTIISIPVRVTHPRQTLIRPDAPPAPPKIVTPLPNIVEWSGVKLQRPHLELKPTASAPKLQHRALRDAKAPELANADKTPGPIDIASSPATIAKPKLALDAMSTSTARRRETHADAGAAPDVGSSTEQGGNSLRNLIALSATPAPPAPEVRVPEGNLAARISISPDGGKSGTSTGAKAGAAVSGESSGAGSGNPSGTAGAAGGSGSSGLPAAISVSSPAPRPGNGGLGASRPLNLKVATPIDPSSDVYRGPTDVSHLDPGLPPEKILSGKEVYTLHVNLPNLTSESGSWIMDFAELDETYGPRVHKDLVACPEPIAKADPKYPPELIKAHVRGQIVLYAIIRKDGSVDSIQIVRGLDPQLDRNAIEALAQWKFRPGTHSGVPTDFEGVVYVPFSYINPRE
jgi:TonB family protein